jgi:hypothetical protein
MLSARSTLACLLLLSFMLQAGCRLPGAYVTKDPSDAHRGIRYYRPKPYLFVTPYRAVEVKGKERIVLPPSDQYVSIQLDYLPDFSEEYSVEITPGLGLVNKVNLKLNDGWNLTKIGGEFDSRFADNVGAVAELGKGVAAGVGITSFGDVQALSMKSTPAQEIVVAALNVPLGYYEAVISQDACNKKRLYGWRYVGFAPFNACPTEMQGEMNANCQGVDCPLYGLVFRNDVMVFEPLNAIALSDTTRVPEVSGELHLNQVKQSLEKIVRTELLDAVDVQPNRIVFDGKTMTVHIPQVDRSVLVAIEKKVKQIVGDEYTVQVIEDQP